MLVLAVESATDTAAVALADEDGALGSFVVARGRRHTETIAPAIDALCRRVGVALADLDVLGVDVGPGLFTGLRVGVGTVKALAFALELPVVTATSLEVLAHAVVGSGAADGRLLVPVVDARRGEVFSARFRWRRPPARARRDGSRHGARPVARGVAGRRAWPSLGRRTQSGPGRGRRPALRRRSSGPSPGSLWPARPSAPPRWQPWPSSAVARGLAGHVHDGAGSCPGTSARPTPGSTGSSASPRPAATAAGA